MVVNFTANIGLAKPTEVELAENWVNNTELQEDNNLIIIDKMDINLTAYTPAFIGSSTNPNVGAGSIAGEYCEVEGFIFGSFVIQFLDPGVAAGSGAGAYGIRLPFPADSAFHFTGGSLSDTPGTASCIGEGHIIDNTVNLSGTVALDVVDVGGFSYARLITETFTGKTAAFFTPGMPMTFATNDKISGSFWYKKA